MSHFIFLTEARHLDRGYTTFRVRADRITWIAERYPYCEQRHTVVCVDGLELQVEEPAHIVMTYIKDPNAPIFSPQYYEHYPCPVEFKQKHGDKEGRRLYDKVMHYPGVSTTKWAELHDYPLPDTAFEE